MLFFRREHFAAMLAAFHDELVNLRVDRHRILSIEAREAEFTRWLAVARTMPGTSR